MAQRAGNLALPAHRNGTTRALRKRVAQRCARLPRLQVIDHDIDASEADDALIAQRARFDIFSEVFRSPMTPPTDGEQRSTVCVDASAARCAC